MPVCQATPPTKPRNQFGSLKQSIVLIEGIVSVACGYCRKVGPYSQATYGTLTYPTAIAKSEIETKHVWVRSLGKMITFDQEHIRWFRPTATGWFCSDCARLFTFKVKDQPNRTPDPDRFEGEIDGKCGPGRYKVGRPRPIPGRHFDRPAAREHLPTLHASNLLSELTSRSLPSDPDRAYEVARLRGHLAGLIKRGM